MITIENSTINGNDFTGVRAILDNKMNIIKVTSLADGADVTESYIEKLNKDELKKLVSVEGK